jgi:alpha-amylase
MLTKVALASAGLLATASAGNTAEWKKRTVYQVLTDRFSTGNDAQNGCGDLSRYCGGNYKGLVNHLDYIKGMGFDAIWISPVVDNMEPGYHGYWARDWTKTNDHFGSS